MNTHIINKRQNDLYTEKIANGGNGLITFFTPTFNRGSFLKRISKCLQEQTCKQFVWMIINDGSVDNTNDIVSEIIDKNDLPILYVEKENGGKHSAFKIAFQECKTEYFQCMDDDDIYSPKAVEFFLVQWNVLKEEKNHEVGAIRTITRKEDGSIVSERKIELEENSSCRLDATTLEMNYIRNQKQENWTCYKYEALSQIDLFPDNYWLSELHSFFSEGIWQGRFARKFKCRYINVTLREYSYEAEDSILRSNKGKKHYLNMFINHKMITEEQIDYLLRCPKELFTNILLVGILCFYLKISYKDLLKNTKSVLLKFFYVTCSPMILVGILLYRNKFNHIMNN